MALVGEAKGWDQETELVSEWAQRRDLFHRQPSRTRFNRRPRQLQGAINEVRRLLLGLLDLAHDRQCVLDSLPIPVVRFHLPAGANRADWQAYETRYGKAPSKKCTIFGYKLYLLVTLTRPSSAPPWPRGWPPRTGCASSRCPGATSAGKRRGRCGGWSTPPARSSKPSPAIGRLEVPVDLHRAKIASSCGAVSRSNASSSSSMAPKLLR